MCDTDSSRTNTTDTHRRPLLRLSLLSRLATQKLLLSVLFFCMTIHLLLLVRQHRKITTLIQYAQIHDSLDITCELSLPAFLAEPTEKWGIRLHAFECIRSVTVDFDSLPHSVSRHILGLDKLTFLRFSSSTNNYEALMHMLRNNRDLSGLQIAGTDFSAAPTSGTPNPLRMGTLDSIHIINSTVRHEFFSAIAENSRLKYVTIVNGHVVGTYQPSMRRHDLREFSIYGCSHGALSFLNHARSIKLLDIHSLSSEESTKGVFYGDIQCESAYIDGTIGCEFMESVIKSSASGRNGLVCKDVTFRSDSIGFGCVAALLPHLNEICFDVIIVPTRMHFCEAVFFNLLTEDVWISPLGELVVELMYASELVAWQSLIGIVL